MARQLDHLAHHLGINVRLKWFDLRPLSAFSD